MPCRVPLSGCRSRVTSSMPFPSSDIASLIKSQAMSLGFDACGFAAATPVDDEAVARYVARRGTNGHFIGPELLSEPFPARGNAARCLLCLWARLPRSAARKIDRIGPFHRRNHPLHHPSVCGFGTYPRALLGTEGGPRFHRQEQLPYHPGKRILLLPRRNRHYSPVAIRRTVHDDLWRLRQVRRGVSVRCVERGRCRRCFALPLLSAHREPRRATARLGPLGSG